MMKKAILSAVCVGMVSIGANATILTNGDFETNTLTGKHWGVFNVIDGWYTSLGAGIEVQRNTVVNAYSGNAYIELDSHNNSGVTQNVHTEAGQSYLLSFYYMPRTNNGGNDNGVGIFWDSLGGTTGAFSPSSTVFSISDATRNSMPGWTHYTLELEATSDMMALSFVGQGKNNSLGAFIDDVSLTRAVPAPATLALFGLGLAGLGWARRKPARS